MPGGAPGAFALVLAKGLAAVTAESESEGPRGKLEAPRRPRGQAAGCALCGERTNLAGRWDRELGRGTWGQNTVGRELG